MFLGILLAIITSIVALIENNIAVFVFAGFWFLLGVMVIKITLPVTNRYRSYKLYILFFAIYYAFMLITNYTYVSNPYRDFFYTIDSLEFYSTMDSILQYKNGADAYDMVLYEARHWRGFGVLIWLTGRIAQIVGGENSIIIQKLQIVFLASMTTVFLYNMSRIYLSQIQSWKIAISFGLLTHLLVFSGVFNRDLHIALIYTMGFYILLSSWRFRNLFILILLCFLAWQFRVQHGIFFFGFVGVFILLRLRNLYDKVASFFLGLLFIVGIAAFVFLNIGKYEKETTGKLEHYQEYHEEQFKEATGLTAIVNRLPAVFQPVANIVLSQTYPYPPHRAVNVNVTGETQYLKFPLSIAQVYWILVWFILLYGLFYKKNRVAIPQPIIYTLILAFLLIISVSIASYEFRRMLGAYPMIYLASAFIYFKMDKKKRNMIVQRLLLLQLGMFVFYIILKGF